MGVSLADFQATQHPLNTMASHRRHELGHDLPVDISDDLLCASEKSTPLATKETDDMFYFTSALLSE